MQGPNWFAYCGNSPINYVDRNGRLMEPIALLFAIAGILGVISGTDGLAQSDHGAVAIAAFLRAATEVKNSLALEEAWGRFMTDWSRSPLNDLDSSGDLQMALNLIACLFGYASGGVTSGLTEGTLVLQVLWLTIGYSARLSWYVGDAYGA